MSTKAFNASQVSATRRFYKAAWGSVELWIANLTTSKGRKLAVQEYARGNVPDVQNRGAVPQYARCDLLFDDLDGLASDNGVDRLQATIDLIDQGVPQLFVHPIEGTYLAEMGDFDYKIDEHGNITASCSLLATEDVGAVTVDPLGASVDVDPDALDSALTDLQNQQAAAGITNSQVPSQVSAMSSSFSNITTSTRSRLIQVSQTSDRIGREIDSLKLSADIALWPLMRSYVMLNQAVGAAASVASGDQGNLMTMRIAQVTSLRRLCSDVYGAVNAENYYQQILSLNDIATPAGMQPGTVIVMPRPTSIAAYRNAA